MRMKQNQLLMWLLIFGLIVTTEVLDLVSPYLFPSLSFIKYASLMIIIIVLPFAYLTLVRTKRNEEELRQSQLKLQNIFDTLDLALWSHDLKSNHLFITSGIEKLYGYSSIDFYKDLSLWKKVIYPDDLHILKEREMKLASGENVVSEYRIIRPDGEVRWIQDSGFPIQDSKGNMIDFNSVLFDITDRKESEDRYRSLVEMSPDIIAVVGNAKVEYMNEAGWKLVGATGPEEVVGQSALKFAPAHIFEMIKDKVGRFNGRNQAKRRFEFQVRRLDGQTIHVEMAATPILFEGKFAVQIVGRDITERKKTEQMIQQMAFHDTLTGLPNRNQFKQNLNTLLQQERQLAVLFLDLDRFKIINDTKGHTVGDFILQKVADRLRKTVKNEGLVSRQGGDEFLILLEDNNKEKVGILAEQILSSFKKPIEVQGQEFFVTPSIGISLYPMDGLDEETLIKHADIAMYQAKERGKNNFSFYASNLNNLSVRKMELETELRKALELEQFMLYYQPQISLETGEIIGMEALIRWEHPEQGVISPGEFIPLAEETGLIVPIGKWVIKEACYQRKAWGEAGLDRFPIAVNVSVRQFEDEHFIAYIASILEETKLSPEYLELEITESIMKNMEKCAGVLSELKDLGVLLSMDDFGTGYSSLNYLRYLPIDKIKIDKSFVNDIIYHPNRGMMVKTIIDMGINLRFMVVAEGIETMEQYEFLKENDCHIGQGYYFSKPLPAEFLEPYLLMNYTQSGIPII